jgi:hypothetical protein
MGNILVKALLAGCDEGYKMIIKKGVSQVVVHAAEQLSFISSIFAILLVTPSPSPSFTKFFRDSLPGYAKKDQA